MRFCWFVFGVILALVLESMSHLLALLRMAADTMIQQMWERRSKYQTKCCYIVTHLIN